MPHVLAVRPGQNLIIQHLAVLIHRDVQKQSVRKRELGFMLLRRPVAGIVGKRNQLGRLHQIQRNVVRNGLHGNSGNHHVQHKNENQNRGEKAAGSRRHHRTENVVEQNFGAIAHACPTQFPALRCLLLRCGNFNANGQIGRRHNARRAGQQKRKLAIALQLFAASFARIEMPTHLDALKIARGRNEPVVQITCQIGTNRGALHDASSFAPPSKFVKPAGAVAWLASL